MALASLGGRNGDGRRSSRLATRSKSAQQKKSRHAVDDEAVATQPDLEELRQKRAAYYGQPTASRLSSASTSEAKQAKGPKASTASMSRYAVTRQSKRGKSIRTTAYSSKRHRTAAEYVYTRPEAVKEGPQISRTEFDADRKMRHTISALALDELTPDDSISQVGVVPRARVPKTSHSPSPRDQTRASKLAPVAEEQSQTRSSPKSPRRPHRHHSSLFGSLMRRDTTSTPRSTARLVECLTCGSDDLPSARTAKLSCGHRMCYDCLKRIFELSVKDPQHMPPRCCAKEHIPLKHVDKLFDLKFKVLWNKKYQEYHTRNRIYCPAPKCGEWIKPSHIHSYKGRKYAQCPRCSTKACTQCNAKMHKSAECPKDPEIAKLVEKGKEEGWQSCYNCHAMIELKEGCNHMTCRCQAEFCMVCGLKWKTCDCPWFNYADVPDPDRLTEMRVPEEIRVIYRRVMSAAGVPMPGEPQRPQPAAEADHRPGQNVRTDHEHEYRQRQERLDADLARRLQLGLILNPAEENEPLDRHREAHNAAWGVNSNASGHFMNDHFVSNAANVVMNAFGDASLGRRGDRESGRRRRARLSAQANSDHAGLVPNFLGDESVLGVGTSARGR